MLKKLKHLILLSSPFFFAACSGYNAQKNVSAMGFDDNLIRSNNALLVSTKVLMNDIAYKSENPPTAEKASYWLKKAEKIKYISDSADGIIVLLKEKLKEKAGFKKWDEQRDKEEHITTVTDLFQKEKNETLLQEMMKKYYRPGLLAVDEEIKVMFENTMAIVNISPEIRTPYDINFSGATYAEAVMRLSRIQNSIRLNENAMISFCHNKIGSLDGCGFTDRIGVLISQSSEMVKPGAPLTISAGIGSFSNAARPRISINGKDIPVENGMGIAGLKASVKEGKYPVTVQIQYLDQDGREKTMVKTISYEVKACKSEEDSHIKL